MSKIPLKILALLAICGLLVSCNSSPSSTVLSDSDGGTITLSGAFALYPMVTRWAEEYHALHPDVTFDVSAGGAGKGMTDVLARAVDIGMVSRAIRPEESDKGAYGIPVVKDAVFPVISTANPIAQTIQAQGIRQETFAKIFLTGEIKTWGAVIEDPRITDEIHVYTRSDSAGAAEMWAKFLGGLQEDLLGIAVNGDPGLMEAVIKDPLGIGYNNLGYAFDSATGNPVSGAIIAPIDLNNNGIADQDERMSSMAVAIQAVADGKYPSPPARDLYLVTLGKPSGIVATFISWVLTDGQKYVSESGYVILPSEQIQTSQALLK